MFLDYLIIFLYVLSMVAITIYTKNRSKSVNDFLFAGKRGLNGWMSAFAYGTTYFSAVIFIGYAGKFGAQYQLAAVWIGIGNAIIGSLIAWKVLAKKTKIMTTNLHSKTMPEFFEKRFGSKNLKLVSAIVIFVFLIPYSASVYNGLSNLFETVFDIPGWIVMIILAMITAMYLFFGGYFATALSDFIQGIIMLVGVILMLFFFMNSKQVNWDISSLNWFTSIGTDKFIYSDTVSLIALILLTSFGVWALPQTIHKYHAIRDDRAIKQGTIVSTLFALIIGFGAYFIGGLSELFTAELGSNFGTDNAIPTMLNLVIPTGVLGIVAVLILSASMSTLSSVSLASASVVAIDLYKGKINTNASDKKVNVLMKTLCLVFILISVILALLNVAPIAYMMGLSWGTLAGCFIGPYVLSLFWKKVSIPAVWTSIIGSLTITFVLTIILGYDIMNWNCQLGFAIQMGVSCSPLIGVICMIFSVLSTLIVSLLTKAPDKNIIENAFSNEQNTTVNN